ncbi:MAG TPA: cobalamin biosynthesis protein CbiL [Desulfovibrio sp.]|nr:cobalamin biosynthesis protein CbiL [Desulfovibrio sp.]
MIRSLSRAALAALLVLALAAPALAHKVNIFAFAEAGVIHTESSFGGKRPVTRGTVEVHDAGSNELLLSGTTDDEGKWSFPIPEGFRTKKPDLLLIIKAGEGHQGQWQVPAADYLEAGAAPAATAPAAPAAAASAPAPAAPAQPAADSPALEQTVNRLIEAKLGPLRKELAEAGSKDPGAAEILGGLGFLMGLAGLIMGMRRRKG